MSNFIVKSQAHYQELYKASVENPEKFWGDFAEQEFIWHKKWGKVLDYNLHKPEIKWFEGAKLNITENCIDRHLAS
ncbi:MAG: acetyl-coenzyme A synthetase N-terminal domain-containing protein, partial [Bacteroidia bacterium]